jgi:hypothetical protein
MAERSQHRVSGAQDGRSERPATGRGWPEAGLGEDGHGITPCRFSIHPAGLEPATFGAVSRKARHPWPRFACRPSGRKMGTASRRAGFQYTPLGSNQQPSVLFHAKLAIHGLALLAGHPAGRWARHHAVPVFNTPRWARTSNLRFRRPMLYPIELGVLANLPEGYRRRDKQPRFVGNPPRMAHSMA